jgi:hypothetical protein
VVFAFFSILIAFIIQYFVIKWKYNFIFNTVLHFILSCTKIISVLLLQNGGI